MTLNPPLLALMSAFAVCAPCKAETIDSNVVAKRETRSVQTRVLSVDRDRVKIQCADGVTFSLATDKLSDDDQEFVDEWKHHFSPRGLRIRVLPSPGATANATVTVDALNAALGQPVLPDEGTLWRTVPEETAARLQWPLESPKPAQKCFRAYPDENYRFAGARPFSAALHGRGAKTTSILLTFANSGDSSIDISASGNVGILAPGAVGGFNKAIKDDAAAIANTLTRVLGVPDKQIYGEGANRRTVQRWDWLGHAFLLSEEEGRYVGLAVVPSEFADQRGKTMREPDTVIRKRLQASVEKRLNGDVVIKDLPMANQGLKQYCVPATFERAMRHVGLEADMYLLAAADGSGFARGTTVERMVEAVGRDITRKGRSFKTFGGRIQMSELARYIDEGLPVLWSLYATRDFNDVADARTSARHDVRDWAAWARRPDAAAALKKPLEKLIKATEKEGMVPNGHLTMIIGYNKKTGELAFSDSRGEDTIERWIHQNEAQVESWEKFYVIAP